MEALLKVQIENCNQINNAFKNYKKSPKMRITKAYVEVRMQILEQKWLKFSACHDQLMSNFSDDLKENPYMTETVYDVTEELYMDYLVELKTTLQSFEHSAPELKHKQGNLESCLTTACIKLPKIIIPTFTGLYTEWVTFRDLFESLVHNNKGLDNVQKMHYLKGYLTGEAEQLLRQIPITDQNYTKCWDILKERYNNKKFICNNILKRFLSQRNAVTESATFLKELIDTSSDCLSALSNLGIDVSSWDVIVVHLLTLKLDPETRKAWELSAADTGNSDNLPSFKQLREFLTNRFRALEFVENKKPFYNNSQNFIHNKPRVLHVMQSTQCPCCTEDHRVTFCKKFGSFDVDTRRNFVKDNGLCFNCLGGNHSVKSCQNPTTCRHCKNRHHTLLHPKSDKEATTSNIKTSNVGIETSPIMSCFSAGTNQVLLTTAVINAQSKTGQYYQIRALLDQGSQASFVTEATVQYLGLKREYSNGRVTGLGGNNNVESKGVVNINLQSLIHPQINITVKAYILKTITACLPSKKITDLEGINMIGMRLADPNFDTPNKIDILLGAEIYSRIIQEGIKKNYQGTLVAQATTFGWILSGVAETSKLSTSNIVVLHSQVNEDGVLNEISKLEADSACKQKRLTTEEEQCEESFANTKRDDEGRYIVKLPFKDEDPSCKYGHLRIVRERRSYSLENKLNKDKELKTKHKKYESLTHTEEVPANEFVPNRVSEILTTLDSNQWNHVVSKHNPADCASRGVRPSELLNTGIWLNGPDFLKENNLVYTKPKDVNTDLEEAKVHHVLLDISLWDRYSTLTRLIRVIAFCRRFLNLLRPTTERKQTNHLTALEVREATNICIRQCQREYFGQEYQALENNITNLYKKSSIKSLNPFLDNFGIVRIGGRLENANMKFSSKHPVLLPKKSSLTNLIVADAHLKTCHGANQLMHNYLTSKYWIFGVKELIKTHINKCVTCIRYKATTQTQLMGQLPAARVTPTRPFKFCGVDYAGPINLRTTSGRGHKSYKGYIALFVCMSTRAIHIEVVSNLTAQGFILAFRRMVARRGHCQDMWSDNGTNFVGATKELNILFGYEKSTIFNEIADELATNGTTWHFIPPHAPNFGGLWEAGVKSVKHHLRRVIGDTTLTFEEMTTVLSQIEACLNSRPLSRMDMDPNTDVLTPGHFLVGESLVTVPDKDYLDTNITSLRRWQLTQRMVQEFWKRWSQEYLNKFLQRHKWTIKVPEPSIGDVVLVKEDDLPPSRWLLGRVLDKHPGKDGITRVVTLRIKNNCIKRPTSKLCVLPVTE